MNELKNWLNNPNRDYQTGVELYRQHKGADQFYSFFTKAKNPSPKDTEFSMLIQRLQRVNQVIKRNPQKSKSAKHQSKAPKTKDIKVEQIKRKAPAHIEGLRNNNKYVNKILALNWSDLDQRDRDVFFDNKDFFQEKKNRFLETSRIEKSIKTIHAQMKNTEDKAERKEKVTELKRLENRKNEFWDLIDDWDFEAWKKEPDPDDVDPRKRGAEMQKKIDNLKASIRRTQNKIDKKHYKTKKTENNARQNVERMKKELAELENETA